ncbi:MAG: OadG-related small transporter subunit [Bacillota bacterium]|nr:OadG-related small transporter subunit [Bacillota bacterium]
MNFQLLNVFQSLLGPVNTADVIKTLWLLLQGMVGLFVVMTLLYVIVTVFGKIFKEKNTNEK